ncbi:MAG: carboxylesterase family protein, partial [Ruminococcus sp.]|nr:carboxylesterase family protein [Ruminococcus sp.]
MNLSRKNDAKIIIRHRYGVNQRITGEYDTDLAVKCRNGVFVGGKTGDVIAFKGVPFAQQPTGELRWKAPVPPANSDGVFEAYYNGKSPIQTEWKTEQASYYPQGEDCLYLNIWVNRTDDRTDKPVMVFLHGGSYGWGGTADPLYDGKALVSKHPDIILVTVGYRTGLMGFVDFSYLKGGEDYPDAPNLGILDQIEALRWVHNNIRAFGGDPENVTVFGESAGGGSVSLLPIITQTKGLFRRVIGESGSVALTFSKEECREFTMRLIKESGARSMDDLLKMDEQQLRALNEKVNYYNNFPQRDGRLIPENPYEPYENGATADVDILIGTNSNEMNYWIGEIGGVVPFRFSIPVKFENDMKLLPKEDKARAKQFMSRLHGHSMWRMAEFYNEMMFRLPAVYQAQEHAKNGGRAYMYYWTVESKLPMRKACHAVELAYVFGNLEETIYTGEIADETLSDTVMQMWTDFARTGDPSGDRLKWSEYDGKTRATMVISRQPHMENDVLSGRRRLLFPLLRYQINPSYATLDYNVPFVRKAVAGSIALAAGIAGAAYLTFRLIRND